MRTSDGYDRKMALRRSLTNQAPKNDGVVKMMEDVRVPARALGDYLCDILPDGREKSLALTHLEETVMWAIKAIALNQEG